MKQIHLSELNVSSFSLFNYQWCLIGVANPKINAMTASWGSIGTLWNRPIATIYVRPSRYTHELLGKDDHFTLSFFSQQHRPVLNYLGSISGRDRDKIKECGIPYHIDKGALYFDEAELIIKCKKIMVQPFDENRIIDDIKRKMYPNGDIHTMIIGEVEEVWIK
jgi:flavin reductase (DIM6/NTAB) family NADH-FMN oxidoreductase RutF